VTRHLVVDISGHGYGHAAQTAPVLRRLKERLPDLRVTFRTRVPVRFLEEAVGAGFATAAPPPDVTLLMHGPVDVDVEPSADAYARLHADWPAVVEREARRLSDLAPDLLLGNVGYTGLAAAARAGIPAAAFCSLNWADIYRTYCGHRPEAAVIHTDIVEAYRSAAVFLQPTPHLPMDDLPNRRSIGPVARRAADRREALRRAVGAGSGERLVLMTFGGIPGSGDLIRLPEVAGARWLVTPDLMNGIAGRGDVVSTDALGLSFLDLIGNSDLVVTKPGYGTIVEAVCNGTPVLITGRPDWPETPRFVAWAEACGVAAVIDRAAAEAGAFGEAVGTLLDRPPPAPPPASGVDEAAACLADLLGG